jgi:voltage-gated potassium channel
VVALGVQAEGGPPNVILSLARVARHLYSGRSVNSRLFLYALVFDSASLLFIIATSFLPLNDLIRDLDITIGIAFVIELVLRLAGSRRATRELLRITTWTDVAAIDERSGRLSARTCAR